MISARFHAWVFLWAAIAALLPGIQAVSSVKKGMSGNITITPVLDTHFLVNPNKGYVQYCMSPGYPMDLDHVLISPYCSIGYSRLEWSEVEPQEGVYNWTKIDGLIAALAKQGKKAAFGVMNVSTGDGDTYVTPKWVFDDGAQPLAIPDDSTPTKTQIIPKHWDDPMFLQKMHNFVAALGRRYDGNPNIQFIDIRSYGNWGEGHTGGLGNDPNIILTPPQNLQNNYLAPYLQAFPHTQLIVPWGNHFYDAVYAWAVSQGAGIRRDGILSQWSKDGSECAPAFGHAPAVFEYCWSYADEKKNGYWSTASLQNYVAHGKPSFLQWDDQIFAENTDFMLKLGNIIGYHFLLQKAILPARLRFSDPAVMQFTWLNDGIAPLYGSCFVAAALLDAQGHVIEKRWLPQCHPQNWQPGQAVTEKASAIFARHPAGQYQLAIGLFQSKTDPQPSYLLGVQGKTPSNWYVLTTEKVSSH